MTDTSTVLDPTTYRVLDQQGIFQKATTNTELGRNDFIKLLVKQMESQDPLEPMKDQEFVAQLATFSSLEQLTDLNTRIGDLVSGQNQLVNSQSLELIGRQVVADTGSTVHLGASGADPIVADFASAPVSAHVEIVDAKGTVVRTIPIDKPAAGTATVQWDGKNDAGTAVPDGDYAFRIVAQDAEGAESQVPGYVSLRVDGIHIGAAGIQIISGSRTINFSNVIEIRQN